MFRSHHPYFQFGAETPFYRIAGLAKTYHGRMKDLKYLDPHRRATWLELFFDLIFVVALHDVGEILIETHDGHIAPQQFLHFVFLPLWWIWWTIRSTLIASTPTAASTGCRPW